jgi:hypothetical protein
MNLEAVKSIADQPAWQEVKELFRQEILENKKWLNYNTLGKSNEQIATDVKAMEIASKIVDKVLKKVDRIGGSSVVKKEKFI